jgi:hypothetical protein
MYVKVTNASRAQPRLNTAGLRQVDQVNRQRSFGAPGHAPCYGEGPQEPNRPHEQHAHRSQQQRRGAITQDIARALSLKFIFGIYQRVIPTAQRDSHDLDATSLERQDFPTNKNVADVGVLIDKIGNAHNPVTYIR